MTLSGDGGLAMLMGDLLSLRQLKAPVKVVVFKNDSLAFVELEMKAAGLVDFGTIWRPETLQNLAEAAGILGLKAETPDKVRPMIAAALSMTAPLCLKFQSAVTNSRCRHYNA